MINKYDMNSQILLQTILRKSLKDITKSDFEKIYSFSFNGKQYDGSENKTDYDIVNLFPNLEEVCLENIYISNDIMKKILNNKNISLLVIVKCAFHDDFDFSKVPNIWRYRQAGNSIVVDVLIRLLENVFKVEDFNEKD